MSTTRMQHHAAPEQTVNPLQTETLNTDNIKSAYSNNSAVMMSPHEFRILFSEILLSSPTGKPNIELRANVVLAPTQFKAFVSAVGQTLAAYEKQYGEIPWPPKSK